MHIILLAMHVIDPLCSPHVLISLSTCILLLVNVFFWSDMFDVIIVVCIFKRISLVLSIHVDQGFSFYQPQTTINVNTENQHLMMSL